MMNHSYKDKILLQSLSAILQSKKNEINAIDFSLAEEKVWNELSDEEKRRNKDTRAELKNQKQRQHYINGINEAVKKGFETLLDPRIIEFDFRELKTWNDYVIERKALKMIDDALKLPSNSQGKNECLANIYHYINNIIIQCAEKEIKKGNSVKIDKELYSELDTLANTHSGGSLKSNLSDFVQYIEKINKILFTGDRRGEFAYSILFGHGALYQLVNESITKTFGQYEYIELVKNCCKKYSKGNMLSTLTLTLQAIVAFANKKNVQLPSAIVISITCPKCGDKEQTGTICTKCHEYVKCPGCDTAIAKDAKICGGCGVEIKNIKIWLEKIENAEKKLSTDGYEAIEEYIEEIRRKWTKHERLIAIQDKISDIKKKVAECEKRVDEHIAKSQYFAAKKIINELQCEIVLLPKRFVAKEAVINEMIVKAEKLISSADTISDLLQKTEYYTEAIQLVSDYEIVVNKLKNLNLHVTGFTANAKGLTVELNWEKLNIKNLSVKYIVNREDMGVGSNKEIARTSANSHNDSITPGISYFYNIQIEYTIITKSGNVTGVWDVAKSQEEIIVPAEVENIVKRGNDKQVSISYKVHPNAIEIRIERITKGEVKKPADNYSKGALSDINYEVKKFPDNYNKGTFFDSDVVNDTVYSYWIYSIFRSFSKGIVTSKGVEVSVTPTIPPKPVEWAVSDIVTEHFTEVSWYKPSKGIVSLYVCDQLINVSVGCSIDEKNIKGILIDAGQVEKIQIAHDFHGLKYLYAVVKHNDNCIINVPKIIRNIKNLNNVVFNETKNEIEINWQKEDVVKEVAIFTKIDNMPEQKKIIFNSGKHIESIPANCKTFSVAVASYLKMEDNSEHYSYREEKRVQKTNKINWRALLLASLLILVGVCFVVYMMFFSNGKTPSSDKTSTAQVEETVKQPATSETSVIVKPEENKPLLPVTVESISLNQTTVSLNLDNKQTETLIATVLPADATNKNVEWSSNNPSVATVSNGVVTAVSVGDAVITVRSVDGGNKMAESKVAVSGTPEPPVERTRTQQQQQIIIEKDTKEYCFGTYVGRTVNGIPDGQGIMTYKCRAWIARHGSGERRYADKGDILDGTWTNGDIATGVLYDQNKNRKAGVLAGRRPSPYDISNDCCE